MVIRDEVSRFAMRLPVTPIPLSAIMAALIITACIIAGMFLIIGPSPPGKASVTSSGNSTLIKLPHPRTTGSTAVEEALFGRRSVREYLAEPLDITDISQLLWAAQGITSQSGFRTTPSAGALYPLELYVSTGNAKGLLPGVYRYIPESHSLQPVIQGDVRRELYTAALHQAPVRDAPAVIVIAADYNRTTRKYGERGIRYVHMEAGHASENIYLQAYGIGIGTVTIGAFDDDAVRSVTGMPENQIPLYLMPVGRIVPFSQNKM